MSLARSPLAPAAFPSIPEVAGVRMASAASGVRYTGRDDLALVAFAPGTSVAGVFTRSEVPGHPVSWCKKILGRGTARGLIVNAGNANVLTGAHGDAAVQKEASATAEWLGAANETIDPEDIYVASTGVIGEPLPVEKIVVTLPALCEKLTGDAWEPVANAICTTDTFPKGCVRQTEIGGRQVTIAGLAKGSGMIQPDMATMLAFIMTDAGLPAPVLQALVDEANCQAFRRITVDSDTSTSDMLLLFATGQAGHPTVSRPDDELLGSFRQNLIDIAIDLAHQVVRDGEGATKFISITVTGAVSNESAHLMAMSIANSPLVKTAIAGQDANWGRIAMAVGKAYQPIEIGLLGIKVGGEDVARNGARVPLLDEEPIKAHLRGTDIEIDVVVGRGQGQATIWTSDLTHDYISINADYRS